MKTARAASLSVLSALLPAAPAPGLFFSKKQVRRLDCERLTVGAAATQHPGAIEPERPRGDYVERKVLRCRARLLRSDVRSPRIEAVLLDLERTMQTVAGHVGALSANGTARTWLVEAHDPDTRLVGKLRFALQNAMVDQGLAVSDRTPRLGLSDLEIITRLPPDRAYSAACARHAANGSIGPAEALVALVARDPRETALHAGVCIDGGWAWLQ